MQDINLKTDGSTKSNLLKRLLFVSIGIAIFVIMFNYNLDDKSFDRVSAMIRYSGMMFGIFIAIYNIDRLSK